MKLIHTLDEAVELQHDGISLFRYVYNPQTPAIESPRPYFHPLRTLKGNLVSGFRPQDHRWHHGLSMTCANLSGHNFWGGATYVHGEGYKQLENNGRQTFIDDSLWFEKLYFSHDLEWWTEQNTLMFLEGRLFSVEVKENYWSLTIKLLITAQEALEPVWGSPTTQGRENAGYGGLFWRGPREFENGKILAADGLDGPEIMGKRSPWLAYIGQHDGTDDSSTLIFVDDPRNPRFPTKWFVRNTTPMVCPSFMFDEEYVQQLSKPLLLSYKIIIADGAWSREQIESVVSK